MFVFAEAIEGFTRADGSHPHWSVFIMLDCGYHRDGVDPDDPSSADLARRLHDSPHCTLAGIYTHGGHSYGASGDKGITEIAELERDAVVGFAGRCRTAGVPTVGVGSTPTCSHPPASLEGVNEMHPGNYLVYDSMQVSRRCSGVVLIPLCVCGVWVWGEVGGRCANCFLQVDRRRREISQILQRNKDMISRPRNSSQQQTAARCFSYLSLLFAHSSNPSLACSGPHRVVCTVGRGDAGGDTSDRTLPKAEHAAHRHGVDWVFSAGASCGATLLCVDHRPPSTGCPKLISGKREKKVVHWMRAPLLFGAPMLAL